MSSKTTTRAVLVRACLLVVLLTLGACAPRKTTHARSAATIPADSTRAGISENSIPPARNAAPSPAPPPRPSQPAGKIPPAPPALEPSTRQVTEKLSSSFNVLSTGPASLRVSKKSPAPPPATSLFEESILLGKIRGTLAPASSRHAESASLKNGVATISFPPQTPPGAAAVAIAKILSFDGVNQVLVEFPDSAE